MYYNVTWWRFRLTIVAVETQQCEVCVMMSYMSLATILKYRVAQQCFYGELMSPATIKRTYGSQRKVPDIFVRF